MIFTQISCAGKDIQEVWLGGRLVWQYSRDLLLYGDTNIKNAATAVFRMAVQEYMSGYYEHRVDESVRVKIVRSEISAGDSTFSDDSKVASKLIKALLLSAYSAEITDTNASAHLIPIKDASTYGNIFRQAEKGAITEVKALLTNALSRDKENTVASIKKIKAINIAMTHKTEHTAGAVGWAIYVERVSGIESIKHTTHSEMVAIIPNNANSGVQLKSFSAAEGRVFPAYTIGADSRLAELTKAFIRLSDVFDIDGRVFINTDSAAGVLVNPAKLTAGKVMETHYGTGHTKRLKAITSNGTENQQVDNTATGTLWWFPLGDGEPLEQGGEIQTRNGEVLEIQWAFQIKADKENQAWEVI